MSKYGASKQTVDGITFDSKAEAERYSILKLLEKAGKIQRLEVHPVYPLVVNGMKIGKYIGDFHYLENGAGILEDVKGVKTAVYRLKKKLIKAIYGIEIRET